MPSKQQFCSSLSRAISGVASIALAMAIVLALTMAWIPAAQAQTFTVIHTFSWLEGSFPATGLTIDAAGNLYGTTAQGGANNSGTVFELSNGGSGWVLNTLYSFTWGSSGGAVPQGRVTVAQDGSVYGTAIYGGIGECFEHYGCGTVFHLTRSGQSPETDWNLTVLHSFSGKSDGANPQGDLTFDESGSIYGIAGGGGSPGGDCLWGTPYSCGTVYKLTPSSDSWLASVLHYFHVDVAGYGSVDGASPRGGVIFDRSGNLYGVTLQGGRYGGGTEYQLSPSGSGWTEQILHGVGLGPSGGLIMDASGNLYGTTSNGGKNNGGTVFELTAAKGSWTYTTIFRSFPVNGTDCSQGWCGPQAKLVMDTAGNLYGTTQGGGAYGAGTVFKLTRASVGWVYTSLHDFTGQGGSDGAFPVSSLIFDANGNLYGTASEGGTGNNGTVFEITP